jgi:hypothetical protein
VGDKELVTESLDKRSPVTSSFRVTRMRCWRISGMLPPPGGDGRQGVPGGGSRRKRATVLRLNGNDDYYGAESDGEEEEEDEDEGVRKDLRHHRL